MTTKDLLDTLSKCKFHQRYIQATNNCQQVPKIKKSEIDWEQHTNLKNKLFKKYLTITFVVAVSLNLLFVAPLLVAYPPYGKSLILAFPPILLMVLSWMGGAWWAWDKGVSIFMACTFGAMPLRMGLGLAWVALCLQIPNIHYMLFVFSLMFNWTIFTIIELAMVREFSKNLS